MTNLKSKAGVTLVELIVVIAILAILAGVAIPAYSGYIQKANEATDMQMLGAVKTAIVFAAVEADPDHDCVVTGAVVSNAANGAKTVAITGTGMGTDGTGTSMNVDISEYVGATLTFKTKNVTGAKLENGEWKLTP